MYMAHNSTQPFKDNRLRSQVPTCASTLVRTSDQFRSSWRPGPNHTLRMHMGPSLPSKHPTTNLHFCQSWPWHLLPFRISQPPLSLPVCPCGGTQRLWCHLHMQIPLLGHSWLRGFCVGPDEQGLHSEDIEKRRQGAALPEWSLDRKSPQMPSVHLHHRLWVVVHHADPFAELWFESSGLQNCHQEPMVHPIEGLGLI